MDILEQPDIIVLGPGTVLHSLRSLAAEMGLTEVESVHFLDALEVSTMRVHRKWYFDQIALLHALKLRLKSNVPMEELSSWSVLLSDQRRSTLRTQLKQLSQTLFPDLHKARRKRSRKVATTSSHSR